MAEGHSWAELSAGEEFAGYRIERRLGRGGMGILYLAVEPGLDRHVALKLIAPEAAAEEVFARRFAEESRIAAAIEHPNVVPIYAAGEEAGVPFIAMRYVAGSDLGRRIARDGRLDPERATALIAQIGNGLDAIHAAGLVHRDVKPANVLLSGEEGAEHAYITDFGVARNVATESGLTQTGRFVGTLDYVAPEQISGGEVDARADVYALGCLLFKLLTGEVPFPREAGAARRYAHLNDPPPAASLYVPEVSPALDDVIARAMSKAPGDRFPSAGDLGRATVAALSGTAVTVPERTVATGAAATGEAERPEPAPQPTASTRPLTSQDGPSEGAPSRRRLPTLALAIGAALTIAAVIVAVSLSSGGGGGPDPRTAQTEAAKKTGGEKKEVTTAKPVAGKDTLTRSQLIERGDAICTESQEKYLSYQEPFPSGEEEPDPAYSRLLVGISAKAVRQFNELKPPPGLKKPFGEYVKSQEKVAKWDRDALKAAEAEDTAAYLKAREDRNNTAEERRQLAEAVGFHTCSGSEL
jgi:serine/threonine protein kinase